MVPRLSYFSPIDREMFRHVRPFQAGDIRWATQASRYARRAFFPLDRLAKPCARSRLRGGQRQLAMIAMALALEPSQLIANEWTTALDVTTQVQILADWSNFRQGMGPDADTVRRLTANHHIRESRRRCPAPASRRR